jgi:3-dehydro-L-gulonate 2-dehydrogenase
MNPRLFPDEIHTAVLAVLLPLINDKDAVEKLAAIFTDAELDGVSSHGLARLPRLIDEIRRREIRVNSELQKLDSLGAWESWDGLSGIGPLNALACTERVVSLAQIHGVGCVALRNTSHWLRPGYYGKLAAGQGCAFVGWTNTLPNVVPYGGKTAGIGNNPLTIAIPGREQCFLLDMAMSQFSYGKLSEYAASGSNLPTPGGYDVEGRLTDDPRDILALGSAAPIGLWKGSGLAMALDLLAALLSNGRSTLDIGQSPGEQGVSQVFIAFDLLRYYGRDVCLDRAAELFAQLKAANPGIHLPGERTALRRKHNLSEGVEVDQALWRRIVEKTL